MTLRVVGSGVGRTGTKSLKEALEILLGGPCYHMIEVFGHPDHSPQWHAAVQGEPVDWDALLDGYRAAVDWPAAACWKELAAANPDAVILHSERPAEDWFRSASSTIFVGLSGSEGRRDDLPEPWFAMVDAMMRERFTPDFLDRDAAVAAYERWNADVKATADPSRLLVWKTGDGWEPICEALGVTVPDEPFPHTNTTEEFRKFAGYDS